MRHHATEATSEAGTTFDIGACLEVAGTVLREGASPDCNALPVGLITLTGLLVPSNNM